MSTITIRKGTADDLDRIVEIVNIVIPIMQGNNNFQWDEHYPTRDHFATDIVEGNCYVAVDAQESGDVVVGVIAHTESVEETYADAGCDMTQPCVVPHRLAVHPACQGKGVAQKLMLYADELARQRGYRFVRVDTNKINTAMQNIFLKIGYEFKGEISLPGKPGDMRFYCYEKSV